MSGFGITGSTGSLQSADFDLLVRKIMHRVCTLYWTALCMATPEKCAKYVAWALARANARKRHMCADTWGEPEYY